MASLLLVIIIGLTFYMLANAPSNVGYHEPTKEEEEYRTKQILAQMKRARSRLTSNPDVWERN